MSVREGVVRGGVMCEGVRGGVVCVCVSDCSVYSWGNLQWSA